MNTRTLAYIAPLLVAVWMLEACGSSEFRGGSIGGSTIKGKEVNKQSSDDAEPHQGTAIAVPVQNPDGTVDPIDSGTDHEELPLDQSVVFANDKVYRIGDGVIKGTSCLKGVKAYNKAGTKYSFGFEVSADDTTLQIKIDTLCGIDVADFNLLYIEKDSDQMQKASLNAGQENVTLQAIKLNAGSYSLVVESTEITSGEFVGHFDDFIVGKIHVNSNKKIIPGEVIAQ